MFSNQNEKKLYLLSHIITQQYHVSKQIDKELLEQWLQLSNVSNMTKVCEAFYRGNLYYQSDK